MKPFRILLSGKYNVDTNRIELFARDMEAERETADYITKEMLEDGLINGLMTTDEFVVYKLHNLLGLIIEDIKYRSASSANI